MVYKTYKCNSYNIHTIKTDRFKTVHMEIIFRKNIVKEELVNYAFLVDMLMESSKNYPKRKDVITKLEELYKLVVYGTTIKTGNVLSSNFMADFIDPKFIDEEEEKRLEPYYSRVLSDLESRWNMSQEDYQMFLEQVEKNHGIVNYEDCMNYMEEWYEREDKS